MIQLDPQEEKIVRELIKNPRQSDNKISKQTSIPVMTVNRKRKKLEAGGRLFYHTVINRGDREGHEFKARQLYTIQFKVGITKEMFVKEILNDKHSFQMNAKYQANSYLGEQDGHLALVIMLEAETQSELMEVFNGEIITSVKKRYGDDCINKIQTVRLDLPVRVHHSYLPNVNLENGVIKSDWPDEWIYVQ